MNLIFRLVKQEPFDNFPTHHMFFEDFRDIFRGHSMVPDPLRIDNHIRAEVAQPKTDALCFFDLVLKVSSQDLLSKSGSNFARTPTASAVGTYANEDLFFKREISQSLKSRLKKGLPAGKSGI